MCGTNQTSRPPSEFLKWLEILQEGMHQMRNLAEEIEEHIEHGYFGIDNATNGVRVALDEVMDIQAALEPAIRFVLAVPEPTPPDIVTEWMDRWNECVYDWGWAVDIFYDQIEKNTVQIRN